ncbi:ABC transporter permease [Microbispora siamensis]|uniref:ABC transporter permease n=1 Tax=Microbispora siamensis TaxID=564413 RepID=A0ABQ4GRQ9_9ACTN|nr:ABC transporter permease [Microbispora siamensis]GIH64121.1 ABC transporter permease [Microbispora siamensis]
MLLSTILQNAAPYVLAATGCLLADRAGVVNIASEGMMLFGALAAVLGAGYSGFGLVGLLAAIVVASLLAAILAIFHLHLRANLILAGLAVNLLATGGTVLVLYSLTGRTGDSSGIPQGSLPEIAIPGAEHVPVLASLSGQSIVVWLALISLPATLYLWHRTRLGLYIRAAGESESALVESGLRPNRVRWAALLLSGLLCGMAGAQLSLSTTHGFVRDMVAGRGFIALGAMYLGARTPVGTFVAASLFGVLDAVATVLQVRTNFSTQILLSIPYVAILLALFLNGQRLRRVRRGIGGVS